MNVLFILRDHRNPVFYGCYGEIKRNLNLDKFAKEGTVFEHLGNEHFEQDIVAETKHWFHEQMPKEQPWILNVNFCKPHSHKRIFAKNRSIREGTK